MTLHQLDPTNDNPDFFSTSDTFKLRWFTPAAEVPLCGHATLASAAALFSECHNASSALFFHTLSGVLSVTRKQQGDSNMLQMSLPIAAAVDRLPAALLPTSNSPADSGDNLGSISQMPRLLATDSKLLHLVAAALQGLPREALHNPSAETTEAGAGAAGAASSSSSGQLAGWPSSVVQHVGFVSSVKYMLVVLKAGVGKTGLQLIKPDYGAMEAAASAQDVTGIIVTAQATAAEADDAQYDFYSRFFAPWAGIPEDPVTGSAHAVLAPYWSKVLGKQQLVARQCSPRGGDVWMNLDQEPGRVMVSGEAVVVMEAVLRV
eukprot:gene6687-6910_t